ncbi:MAG: hypothetical protein ACTHNU_09705, partial [Gaiellales bacterium]
MAAREWATAAWRADAQVWVEERLGDLGMLPCGPLEQVSRHPWSCVLRASTAHGDVYFKANIPVLFHEPSLVRLLGEIDAQTALPVLAEDAQR